MANAVALSQAPDVKPRADPVAPNLQARSDGLDQKAIDADPAAYAKWHQEAQAAGFNYGPANAGAAPGSAAPTGMLAPSTLSNFYDQYINSTPANSKATTWTPDTNSTVQGQLKGLLDAGSPLMTQAQTQALQQMNSRGLLNSSMAVGAGQGAVINAALPIATADANTFARSQSEGATAQNQSTEAARAAGVAGAQQEAGFKQQTALQAGDIAGQKALQSTQIASTEKLQGAQLATQEKMQLLDQAHQDKLQAADQIFKANLQTQSLDVQQGMQKYQLAVQEAMQGKDNATKTAIAQLDATTQTSLADINNKYKVQLQTNASMAQTFSQLTASIASVMSDPNLDGAAKQAYIDSLTKTYSAGMEIQAALTGLDIGTLATGGAPNPEATPTAPPAPPPAAAPPPRDYEVGGGG